MSRRRLIRLRPVRRPRPNPRPAAWAEPLDGYGVKNFHRITPGLYRSAQPTHDGMRTLERLGIKTVVNLRHFSSDRALVAGTALVLEEVRVHTWRVRDAHVLRVMRLLQESARGPLLMHCWHGADRTGLMSAMYRMLIQQWSREDAIEELLHGGYGFHRGWRNITEYLERVDVPRLQNALGGRPRD